MNTHDISRSAVEHGRVSTRKPDDVDEFLLGLVRWMQEWGPLLRDMEAHPEKYPEPVFTNSLRQRK